MREQSAIETGKIFPADGEKSFVTKGNFFLALAVYFAIQVVLRLVTSGTADLDESQQLVLTQQLHWGYGPQPPLYVWLQMLVFKIFTPSILGLSLLKNLLLFGTYSLTYLNARLITRSHALAAAAAACLLFIPQIAWESQRDLTDSVLVTTLAAAAFHFFLRLRERRSAANYFFFGLCCGLGLLSKYNFAVFLLGLAVAALTLPSFRKIIFCPKIFFALAVFALVVLPHAIWAFQNAGDATATSHKLKIHGDALSFKMVLTGWKNLVSATATHVGALVGILGMLALSSSKPSPRDPAARDFARLILRGVLVVLATLACAVVTFKVTGFRDRWFLPVFFWLPVALIVLWRHRLGAKQLRVLFALACVVALSVIIAMPSRVWFAEKLGRRELLNAPFDKIVAVRAAYSERYLAESFWIGGNLRLRFPQTKVLTPQLPKTWHQNGEICLVVWEETQKKKTRPLETLKQLAEFDEDSAFFREEKLKFHQSKQMRVGFARGTLRASGP